MLKQFYFGDVYFERPNIPKASGLAQVYYTKSVSHITD